MIDKSTQTVVATGISTTATAAYINYSKYNKISHQSHIALAGGIASALTSGFLNYKKFKSDEISKSTAIRTTMKESTQGSIASIATIVSAKYYDKKNYLGVIASIGLGVAGVTLLEKVSLKVKIKK